MCRLPPFAVLHAIDIFVNKTYTRLPKCIKSQIVPPEAISDREAKMALLDLNRIIKYRLSMTPLPRQFLDISIKNGCVTFVVPNEFKVTLTLLSEALDFPWRILSISLLVCDPEISAGSPLLHPLQTRFLHSQAQSRILYQHFDKRPPLLHLYEMLHSFSVSVQLNVLFEQAQRLLSRRPADTFVIESYRPGSQLKVRYWLGLSRCHFQAPLGADGKLKQSAYTVTIHTDPLDPQRPLCLTHHPKLSVLDANKIGSIVKGDHLSLSNLLSRTVIVRAERILKDLRTELLPLSPGPITLGDVPLCLYVPLLWPCSERELLYIQVDVAQGLLRTSLAGLTNPTPTITCFGASVGSGEDALCHLLAQPAVNFRSLLRRLEEALNRPAVRRIISEGSTEEPMSAAVRSRSLRALANEEARWQAEMVETLNSLRCLLGQARVAAAVSSHRRFCHSVPRNSLPLVVPSDSGGTPARSVLPCLDLLKRMYQGRAALTFVRLFPCDEYYLVCETVPSGALCVAYRYYLLVCAPIPASTEVFFNADGVMVYTKRLWTTSGVAGGGLAHPTFGDTYPGLLLRVTHFLPLGGRQLWPVGQTFTLPSLRQSVSNAQKQLLQRRMKRVRLLLDHLPEGAAKRRCLERLDPHARNLLESSVEVDSNATFPVTATLPVSGLSSLLNTLEEDIISTFLTFQLSLHEISHNGAHYDDQGHILSVDILKIPKGAMPAWVWPGYEALKRYVQRVLLVPSGDSPHCIRVWHMNVAFTGLPTAPFGCGGGANGVGEGTHLYQTADWPTQRLSDLNDVVIAIKKEWISLCSMFTICAPVLSIKGPVCPGVILRQFDAKRLTLSYGPGNHFMAELSADSDQGCILSLGTYPVAVPIAEDGKCEGNASLLAPAVSLRPLEINTGDNPHCLIREHLEYLVNTYKSVRHLALVLSSTVEFMTALGSLLRPDFLDMVSMSPSPPARPIGTFALIALSCYDLLLVYRGVLCMRFKLSLGTSLSATSGEMTKLPYSTVAVDTVQLSDGCRNADVSARATGDAATAKDYAPLPAFQQAFLTSLQNAFQMDIEEDSWAGMTVAQLTQLMSPLKMPSQPLGAPVARRPSISLLSPLESYFAASLIFHTAYQAALNLHAPILLDPTANSSVQQQQQQQQPSPSAIYSAGEFSTHWSPSSIVAHLKLTAVRTGVEVSRWRLLLKLSSSAAMQSPEMEARMADMLARLEELFETRVCALPLQPSAVLSFFRLLLIPAQVLRALLCLFDSDLHSGGASQQQQQQQQQQAPAVRVRVALTSVTSLPDSGVDQAAIVVQPPLLSLQLLVSSLARRQAVGGTFPPTQSPSFTTGVIPLTFNWTTNRVSITPTTGVGAKCVLAQRLRDARLDEQTNSHCVETNECALVQLTRIILQHPGLGNLATGPTGRA
uniref:Mediator of RNA polymerase II transcription subunit 14 n=1 Tax=Schistocephalus solidus TaxID=70667 RepID=A0A0X3NVY0_SCHSO